MAILNKIRQRSLFLIIVIALALFSFVLADLFKNSSGFSSKSQSVIATVNGEDIDRDDFMSKVEAAQRQFGNTVTNTQAMSRVWDQELRKAILKSQYDALGITIERDQMRDLLKQSLVSFEEFKNEDGVFDENKLNEFIANLKVIAPATTLLNGSAINYEAWTNFESNIADTSIEQAYMNMIRAGVIGTLAEGELDYKLENNKVNVRFVQIPYASIPDSTITITNSDVTNYINKNKSNYEVEESRDIYFVEFKEVASLEDETNIQEDLKALLDDKVELNETSKLIDTIEGFKNTTDNVAFLSANSAIKFYDGFVFKNILPAVAADSIFNLDKGGIYGPYRDGIYYKISKVVDVIQMHDSIKTRHILIPFVGANSAAVSVTKTEEEAKKTADSVLAVVRNNRSKFPELVTALSSDQGSISRGGLYDWHPQFTMVEEFDDFETNRRVGDIGVVKTGFGFHIIELLDRKEKKRAIKVANLGRVVEASEKSIDNVFNETSKFEIAVADRDFQEVAKENNYSVKPVSNMKSLDEVIPGLGAQRPIVRWAFEAEMEVGDIKRFNIQGGGYAVVMLTAKNKKGLMSSEKASVTALPEIRKEKKAALIRARVIGTTLDEIATSENQTIKTAAAVNMKNPTLSGAGIEPKVVGTAFGLKEGGTSKLIDGNNGVYIIEVTKITPADELPNYQANANRIGVAKVAAVNSALYNALKEASVIEDNRSTFY